MSSTGVRLEGFEELKARLKKNVKMEDVKRMVHHHGSEMQITAHDLAPNRKGHLQASITLELTNEGMTAEVAPHENYAAYVEYGTRFMDAQPYMRPAFLQESARFKADLAKLMK